MASETIKEAKCIAQREWVLCVYFNLSLWGKKVKMSVLLMARRD